MNHDNTLPTLEEFKNVWAVAWEDPPAESASQDIKESHDKRVDLLGWYVDCWLPKCVDDKWYSAMVRPRERLTSKVDVLGQMKDRVTVTREAYGFIQFENSRSSWIEKFKWDDEQEQLKKSGAIKKKKSAPNYAKKKQDTHKFKSKWSDFASGSQCKWDPVVFSEHQLRMDLVAEWRKKDAEEMDYKGQDFARKLCQERHGLTEENLVPRQTRGSKKRSRSNEGGDGNNTPPAQAGYRGFRDD